MFIDFSLLDMNLHLLPWMRHGAHGARETQETHAARGACVRMWALESHGTRGAPREAMRPIGANVGPWGPWDTRVLMRPMAFPAAHSQRSTQGPIAEGLAFVDSSQWRSMGRMGSTTKNHAHAMDTIYKRIKALIYH